MGNKLKITPTERQPGRGGATGGQTNRTGEDKQSDQETHDGFRDEGRLLVVTEREEKGELQGGAKQHGANTVRLV